MSLRFRTLATLTALLFFALSAVMMFRPMVILANWGIGFDEALGVICRRTAALYAGFGLMMLLARRAEPSSARSALISGVVFTGFALAALGAFELAAGRVNSGILPSIVIEVAMSTAYLLVVRTERSHAKQPKL